MAIRIVPQAKASASVESAKPKRRKTVKAAPSAQQADAFRQPERVPCATAVEQHDDGELWGYLGVRLPGDALTRWYPLSQEQAGGVIQQLTSGAQWVATATLNNRALLIQPAAVQRLVILDDDADEPEGDWALNWSDGVGLGSAGYRGLWDCYLAGSAERTHGPADVQAAVRSVVAEHGLDEKALHDLLRVTQVRHRDGTAAALRLDARASRGLFDAVQEGEQLPPMLLLACWGEGMDYFTPRDQVAVLDMPLHLMRDAQADAAADAAAHEHNEVDRIADEWQLSLAA